MTAQLSLFSYLPLQPLGGPRGCLAPVERLWHRIEARLSYVVRVEALGACWECRGYHDAEGYPLVGYRGSQLRCSRVSFQRHNGPLRDEDMVRHRCNNSACVRPDHLVHGGAFQNAVDFSVSGRPRRRRRWPTLTPCEVIFARTASGSQSSIARAIGCHRQAVQFLRQRKTHRHILVFKEDSL